MRIFKQVIRDKQDISSMNDPLLNDKELGMCKMFFRDLVDWDNGDRIYLNEFLHVFG